jgi:hypothetical protein
MGSTLRLVVGDLGRDGRAVQSRVPGAEAGCLLGLLSQLTCVGRDELGHEVGLRRVLDDDDRGSS